MTNRIAAFILMGVCTAFGQIKVYRLRRKLALIKALEQDISTMLATIKYRNATIGELVSGARESKLSPLWSSFDIALQANESVKEAWQMALNGYDEMALFDQEELGILLDFGENLCCGSKTAQTQSMQLTLDMLKKLETAAEQDCMRKGKAYGSLGMLFGLAAAIVVW